MTSKKRKSGKEPEVLKLAGNWKNAVKHALQRGKPPIRKKKGKRKVKKVREKSRKRKMKKRVRNLRKRKARKTRARSPKTKKTRKKNPRMRKRRVKKKKVKKRRKRILPVENEKLKIPMPPWRNARKIARRPKTTCPESHVIIDAPVTFRRLWIM